MKFLKICLLVFALSLTACNSGGGDDGGGSTPSPPTDTEDTSPTGPSDGAIRACSVPNGNGYQQFSSGAWGVCNVTSCDSGFSQSGNDCLAVITTPPTDLAYPQNILVFRGEPIAPNTPSYNGDITSFIIAPALPSGFSFNTSTGVISGSALMELTPRTYTIIGTGPGGSTSTTIQIEIREPFPTYVNYTSPSATYVVNTSIIPNTAISDYEASITDYAISPSLPPGLILNTSTGGISGTPTGSAMPETAFTVTANYSGGSVQNDITIRIVEPPTSFSYPQPSYSFSTGEAFADVVPTYAGPSFPAVRFALADTSNALPSGVLLNSSNGKLYTLSGNYPSIDTPTRSIVVKAYVEDVPTVFITASVDITVSSLPTTNLSYNESPMLYRKGESITPNFPTFDGQAPDGNGNPLDTYQLCLASNPSQCEGNSCGATATSCIVGESKVLPQGLSFSPTTGRIVGNSDYTLPPTDYLITATYSAGGGGTTSTTLSMQFLEEYPSFQYSVTRLNLRKNSVISDSYSSIDLTPQSLNLSVPITGWVIDKPLPAGMTFNGAISSGLPNDATAGGTGEISGTPTEISKDTVYTISACNADGCSSKTFNVRVFSVLDTIVTGKNHACVVFADENRSLYCWGDNSFGQLGFVSSDTCSGGVACSKKGGFVVLAGGSRLQNVKSVALGDGHSCAMVGIATSPVNQLYCWGNNANGQVGISSTTASFNHPQAVQKYFSGSQSTVTDALDIVAGGNSSCFRGKNVLNPTGDTNDYLLGNIYCWGQGYTNRAELLGGQSGIGFQGISYGVNHGCANIFNDTDTDPLPGLNGRVFCWGDNTYSKLGVSGASSNVPQEVTSSSTFTGMESVVVGRDHSCAINASNQVYCWGSNYYGQFGSLNGVGNLSTTFANPFLTGVTANQLFGNGIMSIHSDLSTYLLKYSGKTPVVGSVFTSSSVSTPINLKRYVGSSLMDLFVSKVSTGASASDFACIVDTNEEVSCWGVNTSGKLGTGDEMPQELPTKTVFDY